MLGYHILKEKSYAHSLTNAVNDDKTESMQIFVAGPRSTKLIDIDAPNLKNTIKELGISVYAHNTHLGHPWSGSENTRILIREQLKACKSAGILGLVIHLPKKPLEIIMEILPTLIKTSDPMILLEIPSVKPDPLMSWETPEKINRLCKAIKKAGYKNVKICIDTCHIFTSGYDLTTSKMANEWLTGLKYPKMIGMIHLNDSAVPLGNGRDVHAPLWEGLMWKGVKPNKSGVKPFIKFAIEYNIPVILERTGLGNEKTSQELNMLREAFYSIT